MTAMARDRGAGLGRRVVRGIDTTWRLLGFEQRLAAVGAVLLIVSTFGPFSFIEAAIVLVGLSVLLLLRRRAEGRDFHLPFGDGAMIAAAGAWSAVLILLRLFDRPLGQGLLALVCAAVLVVAGLLERARQPADDVPDARRERRRSRGESGGEDSVAPAPAARRRWERARPPAPRRRTREASPFSIDAPEWTPSAADPGGKGPFSRPQAGRPSPLGDEPDADAPARPPSDANKPSAAEDAPRRRAVPPASPVARATTPSEPEEKNGLSDGQPPLWPETEEEGGGSPPR